MLLKTAMKLTLASTLIIGALLSWNSVGNQCESQIQSPDCNVIKEAPAAERDSRPTPQSDLELHQFDYPEVIPNAQYNEKQQLVLNEGIIISTEAPIVV
ncbi:hypothetical protein [Phaeocystidibacter luteus]|uniref:Uncharacterized protein n=1 Tax=Phaeocystidibacter luteus TaxID=911197 RepID=A0A6N6RMN7_9FLAO|nr:hypothetical protein [Phaeocystidibacter luteus]KAB2814812.1 hypothetical protein F8C67_03425 [Phaeocystidibacter luteus]